MCVYLHVEFTVRFLSLILCHNREFTSKLLGSGSVTIVLGSPAVLCQACHMGARELNSGP